MIIWQHLSKRPSSRLLCRGCCRRVFATFHVEVVNDQMPPIEYKPPSQQRDKDVSLYLGPVIDRVGRLWPVDGKFVVTNMNQSSTATAARIYHHLHNLVDLFKTPPERPRIAIIRNPKAGGLLDALLADPFASDQSSYDIFRGRNPAKSTITRYGPTFDQQITNSFQLFSFPHTLLQRTNIEFVEIPAVGRVDRFIDNNWQLLKSCHLHVYTCPEFSPPKDQITGFPTIHVVEEDISQENTTSIQDRRVYCDIPLALRGVDLLGKSPFNISAYIRDWQSSGITGLIGAMHIDLKSPWNEADRVANLLQTDLARAIAQIITTYTPPEPEISNEILPKIQTETGKIGVAREKWAESAHLQLQTCLGPEVESLIRSQIPWYSLYYQVQDIGEIAELALRQIFLTRPDRQLAYLLGEIDATRANTQEEGEEDNSHKNTTNNGTSSPISCALDELIANEIPQLQATGIRAVAETVLGMQSPVVLVAIFGFLLGGLSLYSMGAVASLGVMVGFNRLSNRWGRATSLFKQSVLEKAHAAIIQSDELAYNRWQRVVYAHHTELVNQSKVVKDLQTALKKVHA